MNRKLCLMLLQLPPLSTNVGTTKVPFVSMDEILSGMNIKLCFIVTRVTSNFKICCIYGKICCCFFLSVAVSEYDSSFSGYKALFDVTRVC